MNPIIGLLSALTAVTAVYIAGWGRAIKEARRRPDPSVSSPTDARLPTPFQLVVGFVTNFLDTLGIGSFATTTAAWRFRKTVNDRVIPGTLNVGHTLATTVQTFIYTTLIAVDILTLFSMISAAVLGAWLGAGVVARWPKRKIQIGMGTALLVAATLMFMTQLRDLQWVSLFPPGGEALGVRGLALGVAVGVNFMLGALMTLGIGMYAPCMILVSLLGMNPTAAFPIMMGSCAFLMPVGSLKFIREKAYALRPALGLLIGGIPGVLLAAYLLTNLPIIYVRWLVIVVVIYTSISMLYSALGSKESVNAQAIKAGA